MPSPPSTRPASDPAQLARVVATLGETRRLAKAAEQLFRDAGRDFYLLSADHRLPLCLIERDLKCLAEKLADAEEDFRRARDGTRVAGERRAAA